MKGVTKVKSPRRRTPRGKRNSEAEIKHNIPDDATFAFQIRDGCGWGYSMKTLASNHSEGVFHFGPNRFLFERMSDVHNVINVISMDMDKILVKGDFSDHPNGFNFGFKFTDIIQRTTHLIERHDSIMIYFKARGDERMYIEQLNPVTRSVSRSMITYVDIYHRPYHEMNIGIPNEPNVSFRVKAFCSDCALLSSAKSQSVIFHCGPLGIALVGIGDNGEEIKTKFFATEGSQGDAETIARTIANPILEVAIPIKKFKNLINIRNTAHGKAMVDIYYEKNMPLGIYCPYLGVGVQKFYARDVVSQSI